MQGEVEVPVTKPVDLWQPNESSAKAYERYLVPLFFAEGARSLIELVPLKGGERVLDVACGTGIVARTAAERLGNHGTVLGLDLNEGMLEVAPTTSSNIHPLIEWRKGDVKEIPFHDLSFDCYFFVSKASNSSSICWLRYERYIVCSRQPAALF